MKSYNSSLFGLIPKPETFEELIPLIYDSPLIKGSFTTRMWRGHGKIEWPVHSSAYRRLSLSKGGVTEDQMRRYEEGLLERATHRGFRQTDGRALSDLELLAKLQHHGAATRLVDTSRNGLVGLWFAVSTEPASVGALIGVHTDHLGGYEGQPETRPYLEVMKDCDGKDYPMTWEPTIVTSRVAAQHSQILFSAVSNDLRGSLALPSDPRVSLVIAISPSVKAQSVKVLREAFDIHHLTLFPDLDGFGQAHSHRRSVRSDYRW